MEGTTVLTIAIPVLVALGALVLFTTSRRRDTGAALSREARTRDRGQSPFLVDEADVGAVSGREVELAAARSGRGPGTDIEPVRPSAPVAYVAPDPEFIGVTRRQFFNRSIIAMFGLGLTGFGAACLAFLWPTLKGGFGGTITVGKLEDVISEATSSREPFYVSEGRFYLNPYPAAAVSSAAGVYSSSVLPGLEQGVIALYQKCPHLGCRVPWCDTSQWFECGCHGSQYNRVGEKKGGPAPRGMDMFPVAVSGGTVSVDTGIVIQGVPIGTNTTGQEAEGPHCVGGGSH
ncbi:MAG: Rieske 2Fe-2S domain-containing protein [Acidimicrobiia bacterium]|nr:Rieske 2Fe-2S domain-containing protein [Acidimicrobiia bacterium]